MNLVDLIVAIVLALLTLAFTIWAAVVGWGVKIITKAVDEARKDSAQFHRDFNSYVREMEGRVSRLEEKVK